MYSNDSYIAEKFYDQLYERNETTHETDCGHCGGDGKEYLSDCCGAEIIDGICQDIECLKPCAVSDELCHVCKGEGVL